MSNGVLYQWLQKQPRNVHFVRLLCMVERDSQPITKSHLFDGKVLSDEKEFLAQDHEMSIWCLDCVPQ